VGVALPEVPVAGREHRQALVYDGDRSEGRTTVAPCDQEELVSRHQSAEGREGQFSYVFLFALYSLSDNLTHFFQAKLENQSEAKEQDDTKMPTLKVCDSLIKLHIGDALNMGKVLPSEHYGIPRALYSPLDFAFEYFIF
jgi:hypothetical protein